MSRDSRSESEVNGRTEKKGETPSSKKLFTCMYSNVKSLRNKQDELRCRIKQLKPDIIGLTEVWQKEAFALEGYHPALRKDRLENQVGGGVMLLVKDSFPVVECVQLNEMKFDDAVWCMVKPTRTVKILVGICYRSPASTAENNERLINIIQHARRTQATSLLLMGDFNYGQIDWKAGLVRGSEHSDAAMFFETIQDLFLYQHVNFPTRFREGCISSQLDLVFSSEELMVNNLIASSPLGKSDHVVLEWDFIYGKVNEEENKLQQLKYNFRKGNYTDMAEYLDKMNWEILEDMDVEETWKCIRERVEKLVQEHVPKGKSSTRRNHKVPWWNKSLQKEVKLKQKAWRKYTERKTPDNFDKYKLQRNKTTTSIRKARQDYEDKITDNLKQAPKKLYSYIRSQQKVRAAVGPLKDDRGKFTETDQEVAEALQGFFKSVFTKESSHEVPVFQEQLSHEEVLTTVEITPGLVSAELKRLNPDKAPGPDGMSSTVLRACAEQLAGPLATLFKKTMKKGQLPQDWKRATIVPIFKKGNRSAPSNYRPVSLTSQVCKVMEQLVKTQIVEHLEDNNLLSQHQHGFRRMRSCQSNLLDSLEEWTQILDEGKELDIIYLDYQKAFDTVPHKRLIIKLGAYGLKGDILQWLRDFLHERQQQVRVGSGQSSWARVTSGVPQGSVLGPVLFLLYVNELPRLIHSRVKMFADDMKLYRAICSDRDTKLLQQDLDTLSLWADTWLLKFNISKCKVMHCGASNRKATYNIKQDGVPEPLEETHQEKDLGVMVENTLKPTLHCNKAANRGMFALKQIKGTFGMLRKKNFKPIYNAFVRPHIEYCIQAVGPYMVQNFKALEKVQRRATKMVHGLRNVPYRERLKRPELSCLEQRVLRGDLIETYKIMTGKTMLDPDHFFERDSNDRTRGHQLKLKKKRAKHLSRLKFFSHRVVSHWNSLPGEVVTATSTNIFKNRLDQHWAIRNPLET